MAKAETDFLIDYVRSTCGDTVASWLQIVLQWQSQQVSNAVINIINSGNVVNNYYETTLPQESTAPVIDVPVLIEPAHEQITAPAVTVEQQLVASVELAPIVMTEPIYTLPLLDYNLIDPPKAWILPSSDSIVNTPIFSEVLTQPVIAPDPAPIVAIDPVWPAPDSINPQYWEGDSLANTLGVNGSYNDAQLMGFGGNDMLFGGNGNDRIYGGDGGDTILGDFGNDILYGESGVDFIYGSEGDDTIFGGDQGDYITSNAGSDVLWGGNGSDNFFYYDLREMMGDTIKDFQVGEDKIFMWQIDANPNVVGQQNIQFIGGDNFTGVMGEMRFANNTLSVDTNGDMAADFSMKVFGTNTLLASDFAFGQS